MTRPGVYYLVVAAAFAAAVALVCSTQRAGSTPACMTLGEARASGGGYPRYRIVRGDRCWFTNAEQLHALRAPPKNRLRPRRDERAPAPPPPERDRSAEPIKVEGPPAETPAEARARLQRSFNEIADMVTRDDSAPIGRPAAAEQPDGRSGEQVLVTAITPRPSTRSAPEDSSRATFAWLLAIFGSSAGLALFIMRWVGDRRRRAGIRRRTRLYLDGTGRTFV